MIRAAILTLLATGCGRVAFDGARDASAGDDAPRDQPDDALAVVSCPGMPTVFDEDGDLVGDPCDVCPHLSNADQADGDGDGVGDLCDIEPATARQRILFFDGFSTQRLEWNYGGPIAAGQLEQLVVATDTNSVLDIPTTLVDVQLGGEILEVGVTTTQLFVGLQPTANELYYMEMIDDGAGRRRSLMHAINASYTQLSGTTDTGVRIQPGPFTLHLSARAGQLFGYIDTAGAAPMQLSAPGTPSIPSAKLLLYTKNLAVVFDYAILIETL